MKLQIGYGQIDPSAKPDSKPLGTDTQKWSNLDVLRYDNIATRNIATCEHNYTILDGSQEHLFNDPENYDWGMWSKSISNELGVFENPPLLRIMFTFNHKSPGLTFLFYPFSDDWASEVEVTWYDGTGSVIKSGLYELEGVEADLTENVSNFQMIDISFLKTNRPYRFVKLIGLKFETD